MSAVHCTPRARMCTIRRTPRRRLLPACTLLLCMLLSACEPAPRATGPIRASLDVGALLGGADTLHERAVEVRPFTFPADHGPHPTFRTEWWYFTGNVTSADGTQLGYQLTFFRSALTDTAAMAAHALPEAVGSSDWRTRHAWMAHFAVSELGSARFRAAEQFARGAAGLAGAQAEPFRVWLGAWQAASMAASAGSDVQDTATLHGRAARHAVFPLRLSAAAGDVAIDLVLLQGKPPVLQGERGLSRKGPEPGNASYYYSFTRMPTSGTVTIAGAVHRVDGASWLDREWSTSVLSPGVTGWDWMALQLDDGSEIMLYRLRREDGTTAPFSAGTFVARDGTYFSLDAAAFSLVPVARWTSPLDGSEYPTSWRARVPSLQLDLEVAAAFEAQELNLSVRYWEGAVRVHGTRAGRPVTGRGYLEMTGWARDQGRD